MYYYTFIQELSRNARHLKRLIKPFQIRIDKLEFHKILRDHKVKKEKKQRN